MLNARSTDWLALMNGATFKKSLDGSCGALIPEDILCVTHHSCTLRFSCNICNQSRVMVMSHTYSPSSKVLIIGSGVVGAAIADELTQRGARDVTVVDQGPLYETGGSSSHAPGFVFQINPSKAMSALAQRTLSKLDELNPGEEDNWLLKRVGGIELAYTDDHMRELKRRHGFAQAWGVNSELIHADEVSQLWPGVNTTDLIGALHTPTDAVVHSVRAVTAQAERAIAHGAVFHGHTRITDLRSMAVRFPVSQLLDGRAQLLSAVTFRP